MSNVYDVVDVLNESQVDDFFKEFKPECVFLGSLRSGGIAANQKFPAEFFHENSLSQNHIHYVDGLLFRLYFFRLHQQLKKLEIQKTLFFQTFYVEWY